MLSDDSNNTAGHYQSSSLIQFHNCRILRNHKIIREDLWVRCGKIINPEKVFFDEKRRAHLVEQDMSRLSVFTECLFHSKLTVTTPSFHPASLTFKSMVSLSDEAECCKHYGDRSSSRGNSEKWRKFSAFNQSQMVSLSPWPIQVPSESTSHTTWLLLTRGLQKFPRAFSRTE